MTRPHVSLIVAHDVNGLIGCNGGIPWYAPYDLKRFKHLTFGEAVVYGFNTFKSLNYRPLPGRLNIVLTSALNIASDDTTRIARSLDEAVEIARSLGKKWLHVCGGSRLYSEALDRDLVDVAFVTQIYDPVYCRDDAAYFKEFQCFSDTEKWECRFSEYVSKSDTETPLSFHTYLRVKAMQELPSLRVA